MKKEKKVFKTKIFGGFSKKDVKDYLATVDAAATEQISVRDSKIDSLNAEIIVLKSKISELEARESVLAAERDLISQTMVTARETANKIISDAQSEATKKRVEFQQTYNLEINKLATIRNEIVQLRKFATDAIRSFERELASIERSVIK